LFQPVTAISVALSELIKCWSIWLAVKKKKHISSKRKSFVQKKKILFKEIISENVERMAYANS
jgi:hypothetical protein